MTSREPTRGQMTNERQILRDYLEGRLPDFDTDVPEVQRQRQGNPISQSQLGSFALLPHVKLPPWMWKCLRPFPKRGWTFLPFWRLGQENRCASILARFGLQL